MLFEDKIGFSYQDVSDYYLGNEEKFIVAKSLSGFLKVILPHIFGFGLFVMVALHFVIFTTTNKSNYFRYFIIITFFVSFLELFSPFFIIYGVSFFTYIKLFSFLLFQLLILAIVWILFFSIINE